MRNLIFALFLLASCEKEADTPSPNNEKKLIGTWRIIPESPDTFSYKVWSSVDSLYGVYKSGAGEVVEIPIYSGEYYTVGYRDTVPTITINGNDTVYYWHKLISHYSPQYQESYSDTLPATIY